MDTTVSGQAVRQYMMLFENLSSDAWRPSLVQLHLQTKHTGHQCKSWTFFRSQQDSLKHEYQDYLQWSSAFATFEIAHMIAKEKKPNNRSYSSIQPCVGEANRKKLAKISRWFSNWNMHRSVHKRCATFLKRYTHHLFCYSRWWNKTADLDLDQLARLLIFVRFVGPSSIEEEMLFCRLLETTTDVFQVVATSFDNSGMKWEKLVCICTNGALAMLRSRSGLFAWINQKSPNTSRSHCSIHREALAPRTLSSAMKDKLAIIIYELSTSSKCSQYEIVWHALQRHQFRTWDFAVSYICSVFIKR